MRILKAVLIIFFMTGLVFAEEASAPEEKPKSFEYFNDEELIVLQREVDSRFQHWRSDPIRYAKYFMSFHYPELEFNKTKRLPAEVSMEGDRAVVKVLYEGNTHIVHLYKAFSSNPKSVWTIEIMIVE